jgi:hypothetical protein
MISRRQFSDKLGNLSILKFETKEDPYQIQILGPDQYFSYQQFEDKALKDQLMVADNSVLPTLTAAGPTISNTALAIRLADYIVRQSG